MPAMQWVLPLQRVPQLPQSVSLVLVFTQAPEQRDSPALQVTLHTPLEQMAVPSTTVGQTVPQPPQFAMSVLVSMQRSLQRVNPELH